MKIRLGDLRRIIREAVEDSQKDYVRAVNDAVEYYEKTWKTAKASDANVGVVAGVDVDELPVDSAWRNLSVEERSALLAGLSLNDPDLNKPRFAALKQAMSDNPVLSDKLMTARRDPRFRYYMAGLEPGLTTQTRYDVLAYQRL